MQTVGDVLKAKGDAVERGQADDTVYHALTVMDEKNIGALVVREGERVVGYFSERDYARQVILKGKASKDTPLRDVMTSRVVFVRPGRPSRLHGADDRQAHPPPARGGGGRLHRRHPVDRRRRQGGDLGKGVPDLPARELHHQRRLTETARDDGSATAPGLPAAVRYATSVDVSGSDCRSERISRLPNHAPSMVRRPCAWRLVAYQQLTPTTEARVNALLKTE